MKKFLLLICFILLLTGCSTEVRLQIDAEKVDETIKISGLRDEIYINDSLNEQIKSNIQVFEREYEFYDMKEFEDGDYVGKIYKLSENLELWAELSHLRPCYEKFKLSKTNTNISLETSEEYRCGYLFGANNVSLIIESDLTLISTNADRIDGNKLIWNINSTNYKNKSINFNYQLINSKNKDDDKYLSYILLSIIIILSIGLVVFVKKKNSECNEI